MEHFSAAFAGQIVKAAIESNSIKLNGPAGTEQHSKDFAQRDAVYLLTLYNLLCGKPLGDQPR